MPIHERDLLKLADYDIYAHFATKYGVAKQKAKETIFREFCSVKEQPASSHELTNMADRVMKQTFQPKPIRKFYVLKEMEVPIEDIKEGDIFRIGKAAADDPVNDEQLYIAKSDCHEYENSHLPCVKSQKIGITELVGREDLRLGILPDTYQKIFEKYSKGGNDGDEN